MFAGEPLELEDEMLSTSQYDDVVSKLYLAAGGLLCWEEALGTIADAMRLWGVHIVGVDERNNALKFLLDGGEMPPEAIVDYIGKYHQCNPRLGALLALQGDEWMHCHEHFNDQFVATDRFYQEFLIPYGGRYLSGTKIISDDKQIVILAILRRIGDVPLSKVEIAVFNRLRQHFAAALTIYSRLRLQQVESGVGRTVVRRLSQPVLIIDAQRKIRYMNDAAHSFMSDSACVSSDGQQLRCADSSDDAQLLDEVRTLLATDSELIQGHRHILRLTSVEGESTTLLLMLRMQPDESLQVFGNMPAALVTCHQIDTRRAIDPAIVAHAYGLSPAEAQVAASLARGLNAAQIAAQRQVAYSTVKTQIKQAYTKVGVSNQIGLVRHLLDLPELLTTDNVIELR